MSLSAYLLMLPQWVAVSLLVVVTVSFSIAGFLVVHRFIPTKVRQIHNDVAGFVFATLGVTYGVLLAFVVIVVWEQFNEAKVNVQNESSTALVLYKNIEAYPDKTISHKMRDGFLRYCRQAIAEQESMSVEQSTEAAEIAINQLLTLLDGIVPDGGHEQILYTQILQNLNELAKYHNLRHQVSHEELPSVIWIGVVVGAMITIGFTFLFGTENFWAHITMMSLLAALIAVVIYVVIEMDHPSMGSVHIDTPHAYDKILKIEEAKR
ncbi:MAG TPA: DUF4239 domain-containing protein [Candidatus Competibacter sp.]|nr:DUF4239 domain-containing protein [Candidatus Competibacter sp.]HRX59766.1 DUF4239 domain-containing protein [Candidatus Competibacter sp.]